MKLGLIDYYLDEFHANKYPGWIKEASSGEIQAVYAYAKIDSPNDGGLTTDKWCEVHGLQRINSIEELVDKSDGIIVLSPDNPEYHEELCQLPLRSGKPVYVDKTFAETKAIAERIFSIATSHNTPCYSTSALRYASEYADIDRSQVERIISRGPGPLAGYSIHQIEPIVALMGPGVRRVKYTGTTNLPAYICEYTDRRRAAVSHHGSECPFGMIVDFKGGSSKVVTVESDFFKSFICDMVDFFRSGDVKVPHEETIVAIAVLEAAIKASQAIDTWFDI